MENQNYFEMTEDQKDLFQYILSLPISGLNLSVKISIESEIDESKILEALRITVVNLPYCRVQMHKCPDGSGVQYVNDSPSGIEMIDFSNKSEQYVEKYILKLARAEFPNKGLDVPLYDFKLIRGANGKYYVLFKVLHIIADAYALMHIIAYFERVYNALINGEDIPESGCDLNKLLEEVKKRDTSRTIDKHNNYVRGLYAKEPHFTSVNGINSDEFLRGRQYGKKASALQYKAKTIHENIPEGLSNACFEFAEHNKIPLMTVYMLAFRTYCGYVSHTDDVMFITTASRRAKLVEKNGGLSMAHLLLNRSIISHDTSFIDALAQLNLVQNDCYRHADVHIAQIQQEEEKRLGTPENCGYVSSVFTFQPYVPVTNTSIHFKVEFLGFDVLAVPLYINMIGIGNSIFIDYYYSYRYTKKDSIEKFHSFMLKFLETGMKQPNSSIKEIIDACF